MTSQWIAVATALASAVAALWKVFQIINTLENSVTALEHKIDILELTVNGIRERMEHVQSRLNSNQGEIHSEIRELSGWLSKNTAFEPRNRR